LTTQFTSFACHIQYIYVNKTKLHNSISLNNTFKITNIPYCKDFFPPISVCQHSKLKSDYNIKSSINSPELHKKHNFQKRKKKEKVRERLSMHVGRAKFIELELPLSVVENVNIMLEVACCKPWGNKQMYEKLCLCVNVMCVCLWIIPLKKILVSFMLHIQNRWKRIRIMRTWSLLCFLFSQMWHKRTNTTIKKHIFVWKIYYIHIWDSQFFSLILTLWKRGSKIEKKKIFIVYGKEINSLKLKIS